MNVVLSDPGGGIWSSSNNTIASIGSLSGIVYGVAAGTVSITYTIGTGCTASMPFTVNPLPPAIGGSGNICVGFTGLLTDGIPGGTWATSSPLVATVGYLSGIVSGISTGNATISYTISTGCVITKMVTINPLPLPVAGSLVLCPGTSTLLSDPIPGGTWTSSNTLIATVGTLSGIVNGVAAGNATITYTLGTGCKTTSVVTVNPLPALITGTLSICNGSSSLLSDLTPGGSWSSSNPLIANVGSATGLVSGLANGTALISYTIPTGCYRTAPVTVNPLPSGITGPAIICVGSSTYLDDPVSGGSWSSSNSSVATAGSGTGLITGVSEGIVHITYTLSTGCITSSTFTVVAAPAPITGPTNVCVGSVTNLSDTSSSCYWSSGSPLLASVGSVSGTVTGIASGTVIISYTSTITGCSAIVPVVVNPVSPVSGPSAICVGFSSILTDATPGGSWSSSTPTVATVNLAGVASGVASGTAIISYSLPTGCLATIPITINPIPPAISGSNHLCVNQSIILTNAVLGGTWSSSNTTTGTIDPVSGYLTGITSGVININYSVLGCPRMFTVTVNPIPLPISGVGAICAGNTAILSDPLAGGTWVSSNPAVATIGSVSGAITGIIAGTSTITYSLSTGCSVTAVETVNPLPSVISGPSMVCIGSVINLTDTAAGGYWTSSNPAIASINSLTGALTGLTTGTVTITYTSGSDCKITKSVTVNPLPYPVSGSTHVCVGSSIALSDSTLGGSWSEAGVGIASVGSATGVVYGLSPGVATINYTLTSTGCTTFRSITVNPLPAPVVGAFSLCSGFTTAFGDATPGGFWSSSSSSIATIDSISGMVTGISGGIVTISYTTAAGCVATKLLTVNPMPLPITGNTHVCLGTTQILHDPVSGGHWFAANPSVASIDSITGVITGLTVGTDVVWYTFGGGCIVFTTVTVNPLPEIYIVTGGGNYCAGGYGEHIGLTGSAVGVHYFLYNGVTATGSFAGSGSVMDYGLQTVAGTYTVIATDDATGCSNNMSGSASIVVIPTVTPAVNIHGTPSDTVCSGTTVTYSPTPINGGLSPFYQWSVNGVNVATGTSYSFIPADGDLVRVLMTSNVTCPSPDTAGSSLVAMINQFGSPSVNIAASPGDTVCKGAMVTIAPVPHFGGTSPVYTWIKNGVNIASGGSYSFVPFDNDQVYCVMQSNYPCRLADLDTSRSITFSTDTPLTPVVSIQANPGTLISIGQSLTLTAIVENGGLNPSYQWLINGVPVANATNASYTSNSFSYPAEDSITCIVTSSGICKAAAFSWVYIHVTPVEVKNIVQGMNINILPNPNNGDFVINGSIANIADNKVQITITDLTGRKIFSTKFAAVNGQLHESLNLKNLLSSGSYFLKVSTSSGDGIFRVVVE